MGGSVAKHAKRPASGLRCCFDFAGIISQAAGNCGPAVSSPLSMSGSSLGLCVCSMSVCVQVPIDVQSPAYSRFAVFCCAQIPAKKKSKRICRRSRSGHSARTGQSGLACNFLYLLARSREIALGPRAWIGLLGQASLLTRPIRTLPKQGQKQAKRMLIAHPVSQSEHSLDSLSAWLAAGWLMLFPDNRH